jgi:hypothetical protein
MPKRNGSTTLGTFILFVSLFLGAVSAQAASTCKGSAQAACQANSSCSWVKGYTRKDGAKVSAHCKSKPKKSGGSSSKTKTTDSKKGTSDSKKTSDKK